jgi:trehalose/maltose hydrolase-like predicted phosphorylase
MHLRSECVRLLRDRIENAHHNALSDETLGAVATMVAIEVSSNFTNTWTCLTQNSMKEETSKCSKCTQTD